jgi:molybdate transport system permease protein
MTSLRALPFRLLLILPLAMLTGYFLLLIGSQYAFFSIGAFVHQLALAEIQAAIVLSLFSATLSAVLAVLIAVPGAYLLARCEFPGKRLLDTFLDLPVVLTPIALGTLILMAWNTPAGQLLERFGLSLPFTVAGVVAAQFTVVAAIALRLLKATFEQVDPRFELVARTLGCSAAGSFLKVTLPLARRGILAAFILTWARAVGEFGATVMVAGSARGNTATLPSSIYLAMAVADLPRAVTLIVILLLIALAVLLAVRFALGRRP